MPLPTLAGRLISRPLGGCAMIASAARMNPKIVAASAALSLIASACARSSSPPLLGDPAPEFSLVSADGSGLSLGDILADSNALLYFNMAYG